MRLFNLTHLRASMLGCSLAVAGCLLTPTSHSEVPRALTFAEVAREIEAAAGLPVHYVPIPREAFTAALAEEGTPGGMAWLLDYLFATVLDGRNSRPCDGVQRALGRAPRDFSVYARNVAATGVWTPTNQA